MTAAPGYKLPTATSQPPKHLTLTQFIQTVLVGVSGLEGPLVRPKWQIQPPKQPDIDVNWLAFAIAAVNPDANSFVGTDHAGVTTTQRHEGLEIACSVYGPEAFEIVDLIRDGFQIPQNLEALTRANMGFTEVSRALHLPELINERWFDRYEFTIALRRQLDRTYAIPTLLSAHGRIHTVVGNEEYLLDWQT